MRCHSLVMSEASHIGRGMDSTVMYNGAPALYRGVLTSAVILILKSFPNMQLVRMEPIGSKHMDSGNRGIIYLRREILFTLIGMVMDIQSMLVLLRKWKMERYTRWKAMQVIPAHGGIIW